MPHRTNQKGFSLVGGLLIIIALALVVFVGYYVWHAQKTANQTYSSASKIAQSTPSTSTKKSTPASTQQYLTISEWGVKVPLSPAISDAYYSFKNGYVYVSLTSLQNTDCAADSISIGAYGRQKPGQTDGFGNPFTPGPNDTAIDGYYYTFTGAQAGCSDIPAVQQKVDAARIAFNQAIKSVQPE